jgi:hypothetical protein
VGTVVEDVHHLDAEERRYCSEAEERRYCPTQETLAAKDASKLVA